MLGRRPYLGRSRQEIREQMLAKQVVIKRQEIPLGWSLEAADFTNKLLQRKPQNRLGNNGPDESTSSSRITKEPTTTNTPRSAKLALKLKN
ncbi:unnamed protein product [Paramecium octaurelia]|uniref:Uncharacterized protein n=1 Tax=Paramecium octaurelia TaxID=43137 RepID=A0A8S1XKI1_PAROT|nr:unnamed protein product [Paramecium octaurelia]